MQELKSEKLTVTEDCHRIQREMFDGLKECLKNSKQIDLIESYITLNDIFLEKVNFLLNNVAILGPQKQTCYHTIAYLMNVKDDLNTIINKQGQGISDNNIKWIPLESAFKKSVQTGVIKNLKHLDISEFLKDLRGLFEKIVYDVIKKISSSVKVYTVLVLEYEILKNNEKYTELKYFNTKAAPIFATTDIQNWLIKYVDEPLMKETEEFQERDSGWTLKSILYLNVHINKYNAMCAGSSYIQLPEQIRYKNACVNVKNYDFKCFKWAVLSASIGKSNYLHNSDRVEEYEKREKDYDVDFNIMTYPVLPKDIQKFEEKNKISINLYILRLMKGNYDVLPHHLTAEKHNIHINLLLIQDSYYDERSSIEDEEEENEEENEFEYENENDIMSEKLLHLKNTMITKSKKIKLMNNEEINFHYVWIKNLSRLVSSQLSLNTRKKEICDRCLHYFISVEKLKKHEEDCILLNNCKIRLPNDKQRNIYFKNFQNKEKHPFIIYADFESILVPAKDDDHIKIYQIHKPFVLVIT